MFNNVYEVLAYLGERCDLFKPIEGEIIRLKDENEKLKKAIEELTTTMLRG